MALSHVGGGPAQTGTTSLTLTGVASGLQQYDLVLGWAFHKGGTAPATPSGFTSLGTTGATTGTARFFWRRLTSGQTSQADVTITGLTSSSVGALAVLRGARGTSNQWLIQNSLSSNLLASINAEGTYTCSSAGGGGTWTAHGGGAWAIGIIGYDNDASTTNWSFTTTGANQAGSELGDNMTTAGTDCGGAWAYADLGTTLGLTGFTVTASEGSAGTADNFAACFFVAAQPPAPTAPTTAPTVSASLGGVTVTTPPTLEGYAESYRIYRDGVQIASGRPANSAWPDSSASASATQTYTVRGENIAGLSTDSPASSAVAADPDSPNDMFRLRSKHNGIRVVFRSNNYAAQYKIFRGLPGGSRSLVHTTGTVSASTTHEWDDAGLVDNDEYDYSVTTYVTTPTVRESPHTSVLTKRVGYGPLSGGDDGQSKIDLNEAPSSDGGGFSVGCNFTGGSSYRAFMRFPGIEVPQGATINSATLGHRITQAPGSTAITWVGVDEDNPTQPTTAADMTRSLTTANLGDVITATGWRTIDLKDIFQEIVDRPGFTSGNAIMLYIDDATSGTVQNVADIISYDANIGLYKNDAATLIIDYSASGSSGVTGVGVSATLVGKKSATVVARLAGGAVSAPSVGKRATTTVTGATGSQSRAMALKKSPGVAGGVLGGLSMLAARKSGVVSGLGVLGEINTVAATKIVGATPVSGLSAHALAPFNSSITKILTPSGSATTGGAGVSAATKKAIASAMEAVGEVPTTVARKVSFAGSPGGSSNIALVNTSTGNTAAGSGTNFTITAPTGISSGNYLLLGVTCRTVTGWTSSPTDDGFTLIRTVSDSAGEMFLYGGFYGTEITTTSWDVVRTATDKNAWTCVALSGVDTGVEFVAENGQGEASSTVTNHSTQSIAPDSQSFLIAFAGDRIDVGSTWTWPAGWTERADHSGSGTNAVSSSVATYDTNPASASSYSVTATASIASSNAYMWIGALRPAAGAGQPVSVNAGLVLSASLTSIRQAAVSAVRFLAGTATASAKKGTSVVGAVTAGDTNQVLAQKVATTQGSQKVSALPISQVAKRLTAVVRAPAGTTAAVVARKISVAIVRNCTSASLRVDLLKRLGAQAMGGLGLNGGSLAKKKTPAAGSGAVGQVPSVMAVHRGRVVSIAQSVASGIHQGFVQKRLTPSVTQSVAGKADAAAKKVSTTTARQATGATLAVSARKRVAAQGRAAFGHAGNASTTAVATIAVNAAAFLSGMQQGLVQKISQAGSSAPLPMVIRADGTKRAPATAKQASGIQQGATSKKTVKATGTQSTGARQAVGATKRGVAVGRAIAGIAPRSVTTSVAQVAASAAAYLSGLHTAAAKKIARGSGAGAAGASSTGAGAKKTGVTGRSATAGNILSAARKRVAVSGIGELGLNATGLVGAVRIATAVAAARAGVLLRTLVSKNVVADTRQRIGASNSSAASKAAVVDASANPAVAASSYASKTAKAAGGLEAPVSAGAGASKRSFVDALAGLSVSDDASAVTRRAASVVSAVGSFLRAVSEAFLGQVPNVVDGDVLISTPESVVVVDQAAAGVEISGGIADVIVDQEVGVVDVISGTLDLTIDD